ncbi:beta-galactosidase [Streptococcus sp. H31]|uniref:glycoside hydrolase family 35 protein n=1 Tax=Streptococcus huangxiaojuni TaxID=3237239 RepID=UPI0034A10CE3
MRRFDIREEFYLDGKPIKILSGAVHYFRIHPDSWYHSLYNLKALGFNTVETYVPWNLHEASEGQFDFEGILDIEGFLRSAQNLGLYAIIRPSPYICAEWDFGGLPAWLLEKNLRVRSCDSEFLKYVSRYYDVLLPKLARHQLEQGGNILMFQIENEYGSYGEDKAYLRALRHLMDEKGLTAPYFTSDGPWQATLRAGSLIEDDILVTGNFGSKARENFANMQAFFRQHNKKWPLMCMEFWDGWFNRWREPIIKRQPQEAADAVIDLVKRGSINLYMFHGGTNFGFMNGCSARGQIDLPQITSYDFDAILDEAGNPTQKFYVLQERMKQVFPDLSYAKPLVKPSMALEAIPLSAKVSLFNTLENVSGCQEAFYPKNMEALGQETGYILYRTRLKKDKEEPEKIRLIDARDRAQLFLNGEPAAVQYQNEIGEDIFLRLEEADNQLDILVENMGRVNYGHKLTAPTQKKGIGRGVMADLHFIGGWKMYPLAFKDISNIDYSAGWQEQQPSFYRFDFNCEEPEDTYLDMSGFGKGAAFINGHCLGRFWNVGPTLSLYLPKGFLNRGSNTVTLFETEGIYQDHLHLADKPIFKEVEHGLKS